MRDDSAAPQSDRYWLTPAWHGVTVSKSRETLQQWQHPTGIKDWLPARSDDRQIRASQPPFPLGLDPHELFELGSTAFHAAATAFGPETQDKESNQDFALSAYLPSADGTPYALAIVADGVSTATLWAERAARLTCLAAYKFLRQWLRVTPAPFADEVLQGDGAFRTGFVEAIRDALAADRHLLNELRFPSPAWAPAVYGGFIDDAQMWYNTTLVLACLGGKRGLYVSIGDGGAVLFRDTGAGIEEVSLLRSDASLTIPYAVNLTMNAKTFVMRPINLEGARAATMVVASDGVDRTLQRLNGAVRYRELDVPLGPASAENFLRKVMNHDPGSLEQDNQSVAIARAPLKAPRAWPRRTSPDVPPQPLEEANRLLGLLPVNENLEDWELTQSRRPRAITKPAAEPEVMSRSNFDPLAAKPASTEPPLADVSALSSSPETCSLQASDGSSRSKQAPKSLVSIIQTSQETLERIIHIIDALDDIFQKPNGHILKRQAEINNLKHIRRTTGEILSDINIIYKNTTVEPSLQIEIIYPSIEHAEKGIKKCKKEIDNIEAKHHPGFENNVSKYVLEITVLLVEMQVELGKIKS